MRIDKLKHYENDSSLNYLYVIDIIHGQATLQKKEDTSDIYSQQSDHLFSRHISLQSKNSHFWKNHETKRVAVAEQGKFYWERRLGLF